MRGTSSTRDNWQGGSGSSSLQDDRNRSRVGITHNPGPGLLGKELTEAVDFPLTCLDLLVKVTADRQHLNHVLFYASFDVILD